jgi:hypothetical protein
MAAGVDEAAVAELMGLFEAVRYGGRDPTGERAERAIAALERIQVTDADAEGTMHATGDRAGSPSADVDDSGGGRR